MSGPRTDTHSEMRETWLPRKASMKQSMRTFAVRDWSSLDAERSQDGSRSQGCPRPSELTTRRANRTPSLATATGVWGTPTPSIDDVQRRVRGILPSGGVLIGTKQPVPLGLRMICLPLATSAIACSRRGATSSRTFRAVGLLFRPHPPPSGRVDGAPSVFPWLPSATAPKSTHRNPMLEFGGARLVELVDHERGRCVCCLRQLPRRP